MNRRLYPIVAALLALSALCLPLRGDQPQAAARQAALKHSSSALRPVYRAFSGRLDALDERVNEDLADRLYTAKEASELHAGLAAIRARFRNVSNRTRWLSAAQRASIDSDITDQENRIFASGKP